MKDQSMTVTVLVLMTVLMLAIFVPVRSDSDRVEKDDGSLNQKTVYAHQDPSGDKQSGPRYGDFEDGTYRGFYSDLGNQEIILQFDLISNTFANLTYEHLAYREYDYLAMDRHNPLYAVKLQYEQLLQYLDHKDVSALYHLHNPGPGELVEDLDAFSGATVQANKVYSAFMDALNRGLYLPSCD